MSDDALDPTRKTGGNRPGTFQKGDLRINRKGRPRTFDGLRELAQQIAHETAIKASGDPILVNGRAVTVTEMILRQWAQSKDARLQQAFVDIAFGKVPNVTHLAGDEGGPVVIEVVYVDAEEDDPSPASAAT